MKKLPDKTVERLSQYRRCLTYSLSKGQQHIYSHEIARILNITPVQVRRDMMLISNTGTLRKGYDIHELINKIGTILDCSEPLKIAIVGVGNLGRSLLGYFANRRSQLKVEAGFDINPDKINKVYAGVRCYHFNDFEEVIQRENIKLGIITVPAEYAKEVADKLIMSGIKGILNYTSTPLHVPDHVYLEQHDMISSIEKVAYFIKEGK